ncbi:hypothetical protein GQ602_006858 [Ophiocordyceps camponoti-floridani]|uniref:Uncharacterized protein n=1 Tax=Ophiocordyceps camponoti-floridani TaxID=2030778 RepID=A0A8H4Q2A1_9HYPO|nr:hypothetical protein GQ602_006858 [Ophiocordyceps camponoti-floridani]
MEDDERASRPRNSGYKSWKKKYRKMRIVFDGKMQQGEELHRREERASATVKRLAVENDRLLDLLLEINNSPQMPPERRIDVTLGSAFDGVSTLKRLEQLLDDVPHSSYGDARDARRPYLADLNAPDGDARPANFLSADDIDNYVYAVDRAIDPEAQIPTLAPRANTAHAQPSALKNPTSVTNWLRKNAPKIFLQDGEHREDDADAVTATLAVRKRATTSTPRAERSKPVKKKSRPVPQEWDPAEEDHGDGAATPSSAARGKRKRDEDAGYRPGGSSRPAKKKRKSDDGVRRKKDGGQAVTGELDG